MRRLTTPALHRQPPTGRSLGTSRRGRVERAEGLPRIAKTAPLELVTLCECGTTLAGSTAKLRLGRVNAMRERRRVPHVHQALMCQIANHEVRGDRHLIAEDDLSVREDDHAVSTGAAG